MEVVKFAYERKNMLLHIFRLEAKAAPGAAGEKNIGPQEPRAEPRRVEDIIGKEFAVAERMPVMPQTVLLRPDVSPALGKYIRGTRVEDKEWRQAKLGFVLGRRDGFGARAGRKSFPYRFQQQKRLGA